MNSFRFIHAADIHLDSPLRGLAGLEGSAVARVRGATRDALVALVGAALDEQVDFLVIAGDLYDGDWPDYNTGLFFAGQMGRLNQAGIPVYLIHGNHDAASRITRSLELPGNVHVFGAKAPQTHVIEHLGIALHGQSFAQRDIRDNLVPGYPAPARGMFNIGVLHTGLGSLGGHENYAPCALGDLTGKGYDYWALGHVHQAQVLHERPHVVFSGNLQGRHVRETGAKGASLVTVEDGVVTELAPIACDVVRWEVLTVAPAAASSMPEMLDLIRDAMVAAVDGAEGRLLACRIILRGRTGLHERLMASEEQLLADARAIALGLGDEVAWVEKVVLDTRPEVDAQARAEREDALGDLQRLLHEAAQDAELVTRIEEDIGKLARELPQELRDELDDRVLTAALAGDPEALVAEITPYLLARLAVEED